MTKLPTFYYSSKLCHDVPFWVPDDAIFFITICCAVREINSFAKPDIARLIFDAMKCYQERQRWWIYFALIMPDHLHFLVNIGKHEKMATVIKSWKRFLATQYAITWQKDFFDHRIRNEEQFHEKYQYIRNNPVRKGLVETPDEWPYHWHNYTLNGLNWENLR